MSDNMISRGVSNNVARCNDIIKSFQSRVDECIELQQHNNTPPVMIKCTKCGETKPEDAFNINRSTKTGRQYWCKECTRAHDKAYKYVKQRVEDGNAILPITSPTIINIIATDLANQLKSTPDAVIEASLKYFMVHVYSGDISK